MKYKITYVNLLLLLHLQLFALEPGYSSKIFISSTKDTLKYRELTPENFDINRKYPLVLFLHGAGERGNDNDSQLYNGAGVFANPINKVRYPAFVIFPQCPKNEFWFLKNLNSSYQNSAFPLNPDLAPSLKRVKELLDNYLKLPQVDKRRIYVVGLSMGGMATYDLVCHFPDIFAAAIPICGGVNAERLKSVARKVKFRIFHGDRDDIVPVENSRSIYTTLKTLGGNVDYIEFYGCGHGSYNPAFNYPDFISWLFKQSK